MFAVQKGALSVTNGIFSAISATQSQQTYQILVPSQNVFVDRAFNWQATNFMQFSLTVQNQLPLGQLPVNSVLVTHGLDFALVAKPLNYMCNTISITINDCTSTTNISDIMGPLNRLVNEKVDRSQRTTPTMLPSYRSCDNAFNAVRDPGASYDDSTDVDNVPNGAWGNLQFTDNGGNPLAGLPNGTVVQGSGLGANSYLAYNGRPVSDGVHPGPYTIWYKWGVSERPMLSPLIFADSHESEVGLFGCQAINILLNMKASMDGVIERTGRNGRLITNNTWNSFKAASVENPTIQTQFLTPSLEVKLPSRSCVPYFEYPRYLTVPQGPVAPNGGTFQVMSQTVMLPAIPDYLIIYVRGSSFSTPFGSPGYVQNDSSDWYLPPASMGNGGIRNPLQVNFDNFSGLLSSHSTEELYEMSYKNGLHMDWNQWSGLATTSAGAAAVPPLSSRIETTGGFLVLKMGEDITLSTGQAPSLVGSFSLQVNLTVVNAGPALPGPTNQNATMYIVAANSGFFETIRGSSRIIKGVLSEVDITSSAVAGYVARSQLNRVVGGSSFRGHSAMLGKARDLYNASKPTGYGASGGGRSGAGASGGAVRRMPSSIEERLMQ